MRGNYRVEEQNRVFLFSQREANTFKKKKKKRKKKKNKNKKNKKGRQKLKLSGKEKL